MATSQMSEVIHHLRRTGLLRDGVGLTDGQLLESYLSRRDEAALAALVRRHAPMVWRVCRRVLCNHHDAEDAFQAAFLVFVRKAASITSTDLLANWLYGVAHQTAMKARATAAKRRGRERQVTEMPEPAVPETEAWRDLQPLLDEELSHLPDKYRVVIVLCDLEGKTRKEAAQQLACPEGTVGGRLARARVILAKRLAQRGVALSGGALAAVLSRNVASAGVPSSVVSSTIKAATLFAAGQAATGVISTKVAALTEGVLKTMLVSKLKNATAVLLVALTCVGGGTVAVLQTAAGQSKPAQKVGAKADLSPAPKDQDAKRGPSAQYDPEERRLQLVPLFTYAMLSAKKPKSETTPAGWRMLEKEMQISPDQAEALWESRALVYDRLKGMRRITKEDNQKYDDEREKGLLELKKKYTRILKPEQLKRLEQIGMQCRFVFSPSPGAGGLSFPDVQKALKFTDKQKEQVKAIDDDARKEMDVLKVQLMMTVVSYSERVGIHKASLAKAVKLLTEAQVKAWNEMVGEPWDIEEWGK